MNTRRAIEEFPGTSGWIESHRAARDRSDGAIVNYRFGTIPVGEAILTLLINLCLNPGSAHAQNATWLLNPGSGNWNTAANWVPAADLRKVGEPVEHGSGPKK